MPFFVHAEEAARGFSRQVREARRFYLDLRPNRRSSVTVVCGGWERCGADYAIDSKSFANFGLELVVAGKLSIELGPRKYLVGPGALFTYGPKLRTRFPPA